MKRLLPALAALSMLLLATGAALAKDPDLKIKKWAFEKETLEQGTILRALAYSESQEAQGVFVTFRYAGECGKPGYFAVVETRKKSGQKSDWLPGALRVDEKTVHPCKYRYDFPKAEGVAFIQVSNIENEGSLLDEMRLGTNLRLKFTIGGADYIQRIPLAGFAEITAKQLEVCTTTPATQKQPPKGQAQGQGQGQAQGQDKQKKEGGVGTGFFVNAQGYLVTNFHVIKGFKKLTCQYQNTTYPAKFIKADPMNDLALLKIEVAPKAFLSFRGGKSVRVGEEVVAVGFPHYGMYSTHPSITSGNVTSPVGMGDDSSRLQMTTPVQPGNSGGPLLDLSGHVVGVVVEKLNALAVAKVTGDIPQNINFAIRIPVVKSFLEINEIDFSSAESTQDMKVADIAEMALPAVALVINEP